MGRTHKPKHRERHRSGRVGWLRAAVLGANDGIVSTGSLLIGVASAGAASDLLVAGLAGLVAGSMSMAAGEYVSVSSQKDTEQADLELEQAELTAQPELERAELAAIYVGRGLTPALAREVAEQLMAKDALGAHAHDELGIADGATTRPGQAAVASAASFAVGAALPLLVTLLAPRDVVVGAVAVTALVFLVLLGAVAACAGGAPVLPAALRVGLLGALAMAVTAAVGAAFGVLA